MFLRFNFIKIWKSFLTVFPWIKLISSKNTKLNGYSFVKDFDVVSQWEDKTEKKSCFFGYTTHL